MSQSDADKYGYRPSGTVGGKLKESGLSHWISPNAGATNSSGFTALPGGSSYGGGFNDPGGYALFWSASGSDASYSWYRGLDVYDDGVDRYYHFRNLGFSVRCLQNP